MRWFCSCRWVLLWEPRTTDSLHKAHHALKHMPVLIFRWLGKASRQKRYIIYSALRSRQSRGSTSRESCTDATVPHHHLACLQVPPSAVPMESIPKDALGHSKDFPSQGPRQALLAPPEELPRQEQLNPTSEAVRAIWGKETWSSPPREGHLLVMARAMSCTSLLLPGRKISVA